MAMIVSAPEMALLGALTDVEALEELATLALPAAAIPTPGLSKIIDWAVEYFMNSQRRQAPSRAALQASWGTALAEAGIELEDEDIQLDTVRWAVSSLKDQHAHVAGQQALIDIGQALASANATERARVIAAAADRFAALSDAVSESPSAIDGASGLRASLARLAVRTDNPQALTGLGLGLPAVDAHTRGILRGELGILIAPHKTGKSFVTIMALLGHFQAGGRITVVTLENSVEAVFDRLACAAGRIDYTSYQEGRVKPDELTYIKDWLSDNSTELAERVIVMSPEDEGATAAAMARKARMHGSDALIIDQLSYMHPSSSVRYRTEREIIMQVLRELRRAILGKDGAEPLSCLLLHQASRAATQNAKKNGTLGDDGGSGTSEVERVPDMLFGMHQSQDDARNEEAALELLAFRRGPKERWQLDWQPWRGYWRTHPNIIGVSGVWS